MTGIQKLIEQAGSASAVAAQLTDEDRTCTRQLVEYWADKGYVTPKWAPLVNKAFGIPLHELNPAIYPINEA